jgi:ATP-dependent DNA helicase PIF1
MSSKVSIYAVRIGKVPGIYSTWAEAEEQIKGYPGAQHKKFSTMSEANDYLDTSVKRIIIPQRSPGMNTKRIEPLPKEVKSPLLPPPPPLPPSDIDLSSLSLEQRNAYLLFKTGANIFISGPGGSGKSFLVRHFMHGNDNELRRMQITSTTGCSSILLSETLGVNCVKTINSWSGVRLCKGEKEKIISNVLKNRFAVKSWKTTDILVIDEVSMLSAKMFDVLDTLGRKTRKKNLPFGGIQIICLGDMYQLPPVPEQGDPETSMFCFESKTWFETFPIQNHVELKTIFRQKDDKFKEILNEIRVGDLSAENKEVLMKYVGRSCVLEDGIIPVKILPTRSQVNYVNETEYDKVKETEYTYQQVAITECSRESECGLKYYQLSEREREMELLNLKNNIPVEEELKLKKGVPVMCLVNLDLELGISNGSLGVVVDFVPTISALDGFKLVPLVKFANGIIRPIPAHAWEHHEYANISITQIPLRLSYSSTIHKLQGSTLDLAEINLGGSIFAEGQIYVGLSRIRTLDGLYLIAFHPQKIKVNEKVREFYRKFV